MSRPRTVRVCARTVAAVTGWEYCNEHAHRSISDRSGVLLRNVLPDAPERLHDAARATQSQGILARMQPIGEALHNHLGTATRIAELRTAQTRCVGGHVSRLLLARSSKPPKPCCQCYGQQPMISISRFGNGRG